MASRYTERVNTHRLLLSIDEALDHLPMTNSRRSRLKQQARDACLHEMKNGSFELVLPDLGERSVWLEFADADVFLVNEIDWLGRTASTDTAPLGA